MNILTFDIEEWYTYQSISSESKKRYLPAINGYLDRILDLFDSKELKATFFCLGVLAREYPEVIRRISNRGHEIGCHSDTHQWFTGFTPEEMQYDIKNAISSLEDVIGKKVQSFRAPAFSITENNAWAFEIMAENGIIRDSSIFPTSRDFGGFPSFTENSPVHVSYKDTTIKEFPIGTIRIAGKELAYSGGGYFRLMPYSLIQKELSRNDYSMFYFHVRDFDKRQKRKLDRRSFKRYYGIEWAYNKMCRLINEFEFINVEQADDIIEWGDRKIIDLH